MVVHESSLVSCQSLIIFASFKLVESRVSADTVFNFLKGRLEETLVLATLASLVVDSSDRRDAARVALEHAVQHVHTV